MSMIEPASREEVEIEERKPLTPAQRRQLLDEQDFKCGCCHEPLRFQIGDQLVLAAMIDEHVIPLWKGGSNELWNREMWCAPCSGKKTQREARERGKVNRIRRREAGEEPPKQKIRSRGFRRDRLSPRNFR